MAFLSHMTLAGTNPLNCLQLAAGLGWKVQESVIPTFRALVLFLVASSHGQPGLPHSMVVSENSNDFHRG